MLVPIDFEFNSSHKRLINVVCVSLHDPETDTKTTYWLHNDEKGRALAAEHIHRLGMAGHTFLAFLASAECRGMQALGLDPMQYKFVDIFAEWRQLKMNNNRRSYGRYLRYCSISAATGKLEYGRHGYSCPPSLVKSDNIGKDNTEVANSLVAATYHLLNIKLDAKHKDEMRDLIISNPQQFTSTEQHDICKYCESDIKHLPALIQKIGGEIRQNFRLTKEQYRDIALERGRYAGPVIAEIEQNGMPFDIEAATHLSNNVEAARDSLIAGYSDKVELSFYRREKDGCADFKGTWVQKYGLFKEYIDSKPEYVDWPLTKSGRLSRDNNDLKMFDGDSNISTYRQVRKALKGLESFDPHSKTAKENGIVMDSVDTDDNRLRILFGVFGTMTGRNAPKARRFPFAMGAWSRSLLKALEGWTIGAIDYASQEFMVAAVLSSDPQMVEAYKSGDPYLYFAVAAGAVSQSDGDWWKEEKENLEKRDLSTWERFLKEALERTWPGKTWKAGPSSTRLKQLRGFEPEAMRAYDLFAEISKARRLFKATTLGLQYGMGQAKLAKKLTVDCGRTVTEQEASKLIQLHRKVYRVYWKWAERVTRIYKRDGYILLADGWGLNSHCISSLSVRNFPVQGTAAIVLRRACIFAIEAGVPVISPLHDALYFSCPQERFKENQAKLAVAMEKAVTTTLGEGWHIRQDEEEHSPAEPWVEGRAKDVYESLAPFMRQYITPEETRIQRIHGLL